MKLYTKTGDFGQTSLYGGERRFKDNQRITAYGEIDELQASLGIVGACIRQSFVTEPFLDDWEKIIELLITVQKDLFTLSCQLARPNTYPLKKNDPRITKDRITWLEKQIDLYDLKLPVLHTFILQGGSLVGSYLHLSRTICRRAEREVVHLSQEEKLNPLCLKYLNRLADFLFVLARLTNFLLKQPEIIWRGTK